MPAGRPPKPKALKELEGTYRKDRDKGVPSGVPALPAPPAHLPAAAKHEWQRMGPKLLTRRLITLEQRAAFTLYCVAWAQHKEATERLVREGAVAFDPGSAPDENGYQERPPRWKTSPWVAIQRTAADQLLKAIREFGLSPSSLEKASPAGEDDKGDELAALLDGGEA